MYVYMKTDEVHKVRLPLLNMHVICTVYMHIHTCTVHKVRLLLLNDMYMYVYSVHKVHKVRLPSLNNIHVYVYIH